MAKPVGTPSMAVSFMVSLSSLLLGASVVHNIFKPDLMCSRSFLCMGPTQNVNKHLWSIRTQNIHKSARIDLYPEEMIYQGIPLSRDLLRQLLHASMDKKDIAGARRVHALTLVSSEEHFSVLDDDLIHVFVICHSLFEANLVFCKCDKAGSCAWHDIISAHILLGHSGQAFQMFGRMWYMGIEPTKSTYLQILKLCRNFNTIHPVLLLHNQMIHFNFESDIVVRNTLLDTYAKCGSLEDAENMFVHTTMKDVVSWNAMISAYAQHHQYSLAFKCSRRMQLATELNAITYSCIFVICGQLQALCQGKFLHAQLLSSGLSCDVMLGNILMNMYCKCQNIDVAYNVFEKLKDRDVVSWATIIGACTQNGHSVLALELILNMEKQGVKPDVITFINALQGCMVVGDVKRGMLLHDQILKRSFESALHIGCALVDLYSKSGHLEDAHWVFSSLQTRNLALFNSLMGGYAQHDCPDMVLALLSKMTHEKILPDKITWMSVLRAYGSKRAVKEGNIAHDNVIRSGYDSDALLEANLIDMYVKVGCLKEARRMFDRACGPTVHTWNTMMIGYTEHNDWNAALNVLIMMQQKGIQPDKVTITHFSKMCAKAKTFFEDEPFLKNILGPRTSFDLVVANTLINMDVKLGNFEAAQKRFQELPDRTVVSWNAILSGFVRHGLYFSALELFEAMQHENYIPDRVTYLSILKACGNIGTVQHGMLIHDVIIRKFLDKDMLIAVGIIDMYVKCTCLDSALSIFNSIPTKTIASWGAIISGNASHGNLDIAEKLLQKMQDAGVASETAECRNFKWACKHFQDSIEPVRAEQLGCSIDMLCRLGSLHEAKGIIATMPSAPGAREWMSLFTACRNFGSTELLSHC